MESDVIVVDEIEKSMSEEQVNPDLENAVPVSVTDNTQSTAKGIEIEVEEEDEGEEEEEAAKADEAVDVAKEIAPMPGFSDGFDDQLDPIKMQVAEIAKSIESALSTLAETVQALDAKIEGVNKSVAGLSTEVNEVKDSFGKRVDAVEKDTAFRKSADLGEILQEEPQVPIKKGVWGGSFLKTADL